MLSFFSPLLSERTRDTKCCTIYIALCVSMSDGVCRCLLLSLMNYMSCSEMTRSSDRKVFLSLFSVPDLSKGSARKMAGGVSRSAKLYRTTIKQHPEVMLHAWYVLLFAYSIQSMYAIRASGHTNMRNMFEMGLHEGLGRT